VARQTDNELEKRICPSGRRLLRIRGLGSTQVVVLQWRMPFVRRSRHGDDGEPPLGHIYLANP